MSAARATVSSRRRRVVGLLVVATIAAACSEPPTTGGGVDAASASTDDLAERCPLDALETAAAEGPVEITLWYGGIGGGTEQELQDQIRRFNESQDEVRVSAATQGESFQEVYRTYLSAATASADQLPDLMMVEDTTLQQMVDSNQVLPAQACMEADGYDLEANIAPTVRANYTVDDVFWPGYAHTSTPVLYYNKAHFARAGLDPNDPPDTLEELYEAARALKDSGVSDLPFAFKVSWNYFKNWLTAAGVDLVNESNGRDGLATEATFDTPEMREVIELLQRMDDEGLLNAFSNTEGGQNHFLALAQQQSSMLIETSTASTIIADFLGGGLDAEAAGEGFDPDSVDLNALVPGTGAFPGIDTPGEVGPGGGVYYILNSSPPAEQAASWRFLRFLLEEDNNASMFMRGGYLPIVTGADQDEDVQAFVRGNMAGVLLSPALEQLQTASPDEPSPMIGPFQNFSDGLEDAVERVLFEGADVESSLAEAQSQVTEALERYAG